MASFWSYLQGSALPSKGACDDPAQSCQASLRAQGRQVRTDKAVGSCCQRLHIRRPQGVLEASQPRPEGSKVLGFRI